MSEFGIYFGTRFISITEHRGKQETVNISIPKAAIINPEAESKNPFESLIATALESEFAKNGISPSEASVALAGEDLIIRTFDLPIFLSKKELEYQPEQGLVRYLDADDKEKSELYVSLDDASLIEAKKTVSDTARKIRDRQFSFGPAPAPRSAPNKNRCAECDFGDFCGIDAARDYRDSRG